MNRRGVEIAKRDSPLAIAFTLLDGQGVDFSVGRVRSGLIDGVRRAGIVSATLRPVLLSG
jgi:hypothetical protein